MKLFGSLRISGSEIASCDVPLERDGETLTLMGTRTKRKGNRCEDFNICADIHMEKILTITTNFRNGKEMPDHLVVDLHAGRGGGLHLALSAKQALMIAGILEKYASTFYGYHSLATTRECKLE